MVVGCSFLGTAAQLLFKKAAGHMVALGWQNIVLNPYLLLAYMSYGISTLLLILALKKGQLSALYPFIALTFVWVTLLSPVLFRSDTYNMVRLLGVASIVVGVSFIGMGSMDAH